MQDHLYMYKEGRGFATDITWSGQ